jgi:hypothetical protein
VNKAQHKQMIIKKLIILQTNDLEISLNTLKRSDGILPKSSIEKMVEYCNYRKDEILKLNNRLIELERGEQIEQKH